MSGVSAGGLSGGNSPIWPGNKNIGQQKTLQGADQAFGINRNVSTPETPSKVSQVSTESAQATQQASKPDVPQVKSLTPKDIIQQLANIKVPVNEHNKELALLMAAHGIEISEDSFNDLKRLLKGKKSLVDKESAVLLMSKGLGGVADDVDVLNGILSKQNTLAKAVKELGSMQQKMTTMLQRSLKDFPALQSFIGTFSDFNDELKKLKKLSRDNRWLSNQDGLLDDMMAMSSFLKGMASKKWLNGELLESYTKQLDALQKNMLAQIILTQDSIKQPLGLLESFHYFQIPHPMVAQAIIELLLRKKITSKSKEKQKVNALDQEKIILDLDSEYLGKLTVVVTIMGVKVWCTIYSDKEETPHHVNAFREELNKSLAKLEYKVEEMKTYRKKINIQKFIAPSQDISEVKRVETEI